MDEGGEHIRRNGILSGPEPSMNVFSGPSRTPVYPPGARRNGRRLPFSNVERSTLVVNSVKLPCVPHRSGVDIAESTRPSNGSGGNVIGTRKIVEPIA